MEKEDKEGKKMRTDRKKQEEEGGGVMEESEESEAARGGEEKKEDEEENFLRRFQSCTDWIIVYSGEGRGVGEGPQRECRLITAHDHRGR